MKKFISILFASACFMTSYISANILGIGMWFWIILGTGAFVAISQFYKPLGEVGSYAAGLLSIISIFSVVFGLAAATIGGSFKLDGREAQLFISFSLIAVFGFILIKLNKKKD